MPPEAAPFGVSVWCARTGRHLRLPVGTLEVAVYAEVPWRKSGSEVEHEDSDDGVVY